MRFSRLDRGVLLVTLGLAGTLALITLVGDRVGVQLARFAPVDQARSTSAVTLQFTEDMNRDSVVQRFRLEPSVPGDVTWAGRTLIYRPRERLQPGTRYTGVLEPGVESAARRKLLSEHRFAFIVVGPQVAFLAPADAPVQNV